MRIEDLRYEVKDKVEEIRQFLDSPKGKMLAGGALAIGLLVLIWSISGFFSRSAAGIASTDRVFVCSETGKSFSKTVKAGMTIPIHSPYSDKDTGFPAELCYWTAGGQIKSDPTAVLLNEYKSERGPTFCPDCGRRVTLHNRMPSPGDPAPPTASEYAASHRPSKKNEAVEDSRIDAEPSR